jgi:hypothetical protein
VIRELSSGNTFNFYFDLYFFYFLADLHCLSISSASSSLLLFLLDFSLNYLSSRIFFFLFFLAKMPLDVISFFLSAIFA